MPQVTGGKITSYQNFSSFKTYAEANCFFYYADLLKKKREKHDFSFFEKTCLFLFSSLIIKRLYKFDKNLLDADVNFSKQMSKNVLKLDLDDIVDTMLDYTDEFKKSSALPKGKYSDLLHIKDNVYNNVSYNFIETLFFFFKYFFFFWGFLNSTNLFGYEEKISKIFFFTKTYNLFLNSQKNSENLNVVEKQNFRKKIFKIIFKKK